MMPTTYCMPTGVSGAVLWGSRSTPLILPKSPRKGKIDTRVSVSGLSRAFFPLCKISALEFSCRLTYGCFEIARINFSLIQNSPFCLCLLFWLCSRLRQCKITAKDIRPNGN